MCIRDLWCEPNFVVQPVQIKTWISHCHLRGKKGINIKSVVECAVGFHYILQRRYIKIKQVLQINFLKDRNRFGSGNKLAVTCDRSLFPGTKRRTKFLGTKIL